MSQSVSEWVSQYSKILSCCFAAKIIQFYEGKISFVTKSSLLGSRGVLPVLLTIFMSGFEGFNYFVCRIENKYTWIFFSLIYYPFSEMDGFQDKMKEDIQTIAYKTGLTRWQVIFAIIGKWQIICSHHFYISCREDINTISLTGGLENRE